jgi:hypothetical protein
VEAAIAASSSRLSIPSPAGSGARPCAAPTTSAWLASRSSLARWVTRDAPPGLASGGASERFVVRVRQDSRPEAKSVLQNLPLTLGPSVPVGASESAVRRRPAARRRRASRA